MMINNENDIKIYQEELAPRLPAKIFDAHVHIWDTNQMPADFSPKPKSYYSRFGGTFTLEQWHDAMAELLPQQEVFVNCFGTPNDLADRNVVPPADRIHAFANVLISPADPVELVRERIEKSHAVGVKPYWNYGAAFYGKDSKTTEVKDMLTPGQLEYLDRAGLAVTFHIPRPGRFADRLNQTQMLELCEKYPNIRFIWAHIGRAYFMRNILDSNIEQFAQFPNVYFDTAMVNHQDVLKYAYDHFPVKRILFGTDSPIALLKGKSVEINNQYAYLMGENYAIGTTIIDTEHAVDFTTFFYEQLRAILNTTSRNDAEDILFNNAFKLFSNLP